MKMWYIYTTKYYSAVEEKEIVKISHQWIELEELYFLEPEDLRRTSIFIDSLSGLWRYTSGCLLSLTSYCTPLNSSTNEQNKTSHISCKPGSWGANLCLYSVSSVGPSLNHHKPQTLKAYPNVEVLFCSIKNTWDLSDAQVKPIGAGLSLGIFLTAQ